MFERRLKVLLAVAAIVGLVIVGRLFELQVADGAYYAERAENALHRPARPLPFLRGCILDRTGAVLVRDEACWDIAVSYPAIAAMVSDDRMPARFEHALMERYGLHPRPIEKRLSDDERARIKERRRAKLRDLFRDEMEVRLTEMVALSGGRTTVAELYDTARSIRNRVTTISDIIKAHRGYRIPIAEERSYIPLVSRLDTRQQIAARERFVGEPWIDVVDGSTRVVVGDGTPFAHVLGRMGRVSPSDLENDPDSEDPVTRYLPHEYIGITGFEYLAERRLRGARGQIKTDRQGQVIDAESFPPRDGEDIRMSLHAGLQRRLYNLLQDAIPESPVPTGGVIVVVHVPTREVLAMVSYPSYDPMDFDYDALADDTIRMPLRFRAVASQFAPGSTVKPLICLYGLVSGAITLDTYETCTGYEDPDDRDHWRCWPVGNTGMRMAHGPVNVVTALKGSCNIFMYRLGMKLGLDRINGAFGMVRIGEGTGLGLREEADGINPDTQYLMAHNLVPMPHHPKLYAMGQGEVSLTPVQIATVMATYADGRYRDLTLFADHDDRWTWELPGSAAQWHAIRLGMYKVVNDIDGTAYKPAHFEHPRWAICGKTGSATVYERSTAFDVSYETADGITGTMRIRAGTSDNAKDLFSYRHGRELGDHVVTEVSAAEWWPTVAPESGDHSNAWFGGFVQQKTATGQPDWSKTPPIAFSVLVEYGGSGGRTSGPIGRQVVQTLLEVLGDDLDPNTPAEGASP